VKDKNKVITRFLSVGALGAAVVAVIVVIGSATGGDGDKPAPGKGSHPATKTVKKPKAKARAYTVKEGDSLSAIAERTGIPVDRIEQLNPDLDPQALTIGQKLKLR